MNSVHSSVNIVVLEVSFAAEHKIDQFPAENRQSFDMLSHSHLLHPEKPLLELREIPSCPWNTPQFIFRTNDMSKYLRVLWISSKIAEMCKNKDRNVKVLTELFF